MPKLGKLLAGIVAVVGPLAQKEPIAILLGGRTLYYTYVQATEAYKAGDDSKISEAVKKFLRPYEVTKPQKQVVKRDVMDVVKRIISDWQPNAATIISGRHMAGKTVAVNEALRGVRGVLQVSVQDASWREAMYKELGVGDYGMFKQVLRRVAVELQNMPDNPTNYPILLLEVPRQSPVGALSAFVVLL